MLQLLDSSPDALKCSLVRTWESLGVVLEVQGSWKGGMDARRAAMLAIHQERVAHDNSIIKKIFDMVVTARPWLVAESTVKRVRSISWLVAESAVKRVRSISWFIWNKVGEKEGAEVGSDECGVGRGGILNPITRECEYVSAPYQTKPYHTKLCLFLSFFTQNEGMRYMRVCFSHPLSAGPRHAPV